MWYGVEGFAKVQHEYVHLLFLVKPGEEVVGGDGELGLTRVFAAEAMIELCENTVPVEVGSHV